MNIGTWFREYYTHAYATKYEALKYTPRDQLESLSKCEQGQSGL